MTDRHDAARAALGAALAATSSTPADKQPIPEDHEQDPRSRDGEPDPHDIARQIVLRQLSMAPRSRKQLRDKLRQRACPDDVAEAVLDRMTEVGLIDDEAYAGMLVRSQQASRGLAKRALARELRTKGVDDDTARDALAQVRPEDERDQAARLVAKKLRTMHGLDATVQTRRLAGMLARKGYPVDLSMRVIRDAVREAPEHQRD
jgi:regulatory protein